MLQWRKRINFTWEKYGTTYKRDKVYLICTLWADFCLIWTNKPFQTRSCFQVAFFHQEVKTDFFFITQQIYLILNPLLTHFITVLSLVSMVHPFIYQSIYLSTWLISLLKGDSQGKVFRLQGDFTLPSTSTPCLRRREYRWGASQTSRFVPFFVAYWNL